MKSDKKQLSWSMRAASSHTWTVRVHVCECMHLSTGLISMVLNTLGDRWRGVCVCVWWLAGPMGGLPEV